MWPIANLDKVLAAMIMEVAPLRFCFYGSFCDWFFENIMFFFTMKIFDLELTNQRIIFCLLFSKLVSFN